MLPGMRVTDCVLLLATDRLNDAPHGTLKECRNLAAFCWMWSMVGEFLEGPWLDSH
jgi:hypothetical protein